MLKLTVQEIEPLPVSTKALEQWIQAALPETLPSASLTVRIVDKDEIQALNAQYRQKDKPTNVLSFPCPFPEEFKEDNLGDIVICRDVVADEAKAQHKTLEAHWAHMMVHATLHLLGFDHENDKDAHDMETKEIEILSQLGFANPYQEVSHER